MPRSSLTECWVGFVFSSPVAPICGSQVTCTYSTLRRPTSLRIWRIASRKGRLSMSPTVPPTSTTTTPCEARPLVATEPVPVAGDARDPLLDLVGDVRDDLHGAAQVVAAALLGDHALVDAPGGDVAGLRQVLVDEALVVAQVEIGLGAVIGDEHLAVLVGRHGAGVDVDVRVELQDRDRDAARLEDAPDRGGGDALAERAGHAAGHEDILRHRSSSHLVVARAGGGSCRWGPRASRFAFGLLG